MSEQASTFNNPSNPTLIIFSGLTDLYNYNSTEDYHKEWTRADTKSLLSLIGLRDLPDAIVDFYQNKYFLEANNFVEASSAIIDVSKDRNHAVIM